MLWLIKYADTTAMESPALIAYLLICMFVCKKNFIIEIVQVEVSLITLS